MSYPFKKIAIAYSFSPGSEYLFAVTARLVKAFQSEVTIIHAGERTPEKDEQLAALSAKYGFRIEERNFFCESETTKRLVKKLVKEREIDLLVMGALSKETMLAYYSGSVARQLMRDLPCSALVIPSNLSADELSFDRMLTVVDYTPEGETLLKCGYHLAKRMGAQIITIVRELMTPGLAMTVHDSGSVSETEMMRLQWKQEEETKLELLLREVNITDIKIEKLCLYGKEGWAGAEHARETKAGLLITLAPAKKFKLLDRLFQHDQEYFYDRLPCPLLLMKF